MTAVEDSLRAQPSEPWPAAATASIWLTGRSVLGRFNSLIVGFVSLIVGFIFLFGRPGNCPRGSYNINDLPAQIRSLDGSESGFSQYLPVDQGTRSAAPYFATRRTLGREELLYPVHRN
jgi:hypothetical protein